jgi:Predicted transcriptional regulators
MKKLNNIKELREEYGITYDKISKIGRISKSTIFSVENHYSIPNQRTIMKICKGMNLPAVEVFNFDWSDTDLNDFMQDYKEKFAKTNKD